MFVCATYVCLMPMVQKRESSPLKLELQTIVNHHVDDRNQARGLWKAGAPNC